MLVAVSVGSLAVWFGGLTVNQTLQTNWTTFPATEWATVGPFRYAAPASMFLLAAVVVAGDILVTAGAVVPAVRWSLRSVGVALVLAVLVTAVLNGDVRPLRADGPVWADQVRALVPTCVADPSASVRIRAMPTTAGWIAHVPCTRLVTPDGAPRARAVRSATG